MSKQTLETIPQPPVWPVIGNIPTMLGSEGLLDRLAELAREYGPIYQLTLPGRQPVILSNYELVNEVCEEARFRKKLSQPLQTIREFAGDGLFTAYNDEPNWRKAHHILLPAFSFGAMRNYFSMMLEIAEQLLGKWERLNRDDALDVSDEMTRLTLDTIALCGFGYRFNSFFQKEMHPFVRSLERTMRLVERRSSQLPIQQRLMTGAEKQFQEDIGYMSSVVDAVIQERKSGAKPKAADKDLLDLMLTGVDAETGEGLDDRNIRYQIITFLIAGHETTSGLLSFALYYLLKHPAVLAKVYAEVDAVLGRDVEVKPKFEQVGRLRYIRQVLNEALRLHPPVPAFVVQPLKDTVIGGKYAVHRGQQLLVFTNLLHRDPTVWGENAGLFDPENFRLDKVEERPANAFRPFGNGQRACIGRQFALQEATLILGMILQRYRLVDYTDYRLKIKEGLNVKPDGFFVKIRPRTGMEGETAVVPTSDPVVEVEPVAQVVSKHDTPLLILYGSNMGSTEEVARRLASDGEAQGYDTMVATLDAYKGQLPEKGCLLVVSASYNGHPPDNAAAFCEWVTGLEVGSLAGVRYAVLGTGNRDWVATYQNVPRLIDGHLAAAGAERLLARGEIDAGSDFYGDFDRWHKGFWPALAEKFDLDVSGVDVDAPLYEVTIVVAEPLERLYDAYEAVPMTVLANEELADTSSAIGDSKRHLEIQLPQGERYKTGDHFGVLGMNGREVIERVCRRFDMRLTTTVVIQATRKVATNLPTDCPVGVERLLSSYVELQKAATRQQIGQMVMYMADSPEREQLLGYIGDDEAAQEAYEDDILKNQVSFLSLLERYPSCEMPFAVFLGLLPVMRPRYYSISSSNLVKADVVDLTVSVIDKPAWSGEGQYRGVCSSYLQSAAVGDTIYGYVREVRSAFLPPDPSDKPMIMVCAGTGLAPFRGFLQERAALKVMGTALGKALLFYGCRHPEVDFMYKEAFVGIRRGGVSNITYGFLAVGGC